MKKNNSWDQIIKKDTSFFVKINFKEIFSYKDLIKLLVKRDFVTFYKQTILGPLWYVIQPLVNTIVFTIIFGKIANISTDGTPQFIFYMSGTICWAYFSSCLNLTSNTFTNNANIFGKVYFPRIIIPISHVIISMLQFFIQFIFFICFLIYFIQIDAGIEISKMFFIFPLLVIQMAFLSLGFGMIFTSMTTKYKDIAFIMSFFIQLWMYVTPIVYPLSIIPDKYRFFFIFNPMTQIVESFRGLFLGVSSVTFTEIVIGVLLTILVFVTGFIFFNKIEKNFMDTI